MTAAAVPSRFHVPRPFVNYRFDTAYDEMFCAPGFREISIRLCIVRW
jgi:hypothetical protein